MRGRSASIRGRVVLGSADAPPSRALIDGREVMSGFDLDDAMWHVDDVVCIGRVSDARAHALALDIVLRGGDIVAEVCAERESAFLDDLGRIGVRPWEPPSGGLPPDATALLDELVDGATISTAAGRCNLSLRNAHRRLAEARQLLDATTNTQLVAAWRSRRTGASDV